jgi:2-dehydropantoate 2-reductase
VRICVVGCGAIGSLYAAHLAMIPDAEVWAYDVAREHVAAIARDGLRVTGHVELTAPVHARTDPAAIPPCELGIVATKATVTEVAIAATAGLFAGAAVCSVQNGIGSEELIARHVPRVMRGVCLPAGHLVAPGVVHMDAPGTTWIGPFEPRPARPEEIARLASALERAGMPAAVRADARGAQWTKLLFNAATNPLAALTGLTHGELCDLPPLRATVSALVDEGRAVAAALGIALEDDPDALVSRAAAENHGHRPSMLQDVQARRPTEIGALNGGIVRAACAAGVPAPLHAAIAALVEGLEAGYAPSIE